MTIFPDFRRLAQEYEKLQNLNNQSRQELQNLQKMNSDNYMDLRCHPMKKFPFNVQPVKDTQGLKKYPKGWLILFSCSIPDHQIMVIPYEIQQDHKRARILQDKEQGIKDGLLLMRENDPDLILLREGAEVMDPFDYTQDPMFIVEDLGGLKPDEIKQTLNDYTSASRSDYRRFSVFAKEHQEGYVQTVRAALSGVTEVKAQNQWHSMFTERHFAHRDEIGYFFYLALAELEAKSSFRKTLVSSNVKGTYP